MQHAGSQLVILDDVTLAHILLLIARDLRREPRRGLALRAVRAEHALRAAREAPEATQHARRALVRLARALQEHRAGGAALQRALLVVGGGRAARLVEVGEGKVGDALRVEGVDEDALEATGAALDAAAESAVEVAAAALLVRAGAVAGWQRDALQAAHAGPSAGGLLSVADESGGTALRVLGGDGVAGCVLHGPLFTVDHAAGRQISPGQRSGTATPTPLPLVRAVHAVRVWPFHRCELRRWGSPAAPCCLLRDVRLC